MLPSLVIFAAVGYLLGSLPFGYLVARAKGVNIFEVGSKNPGATNVRRVLGAGPGNLVFALDALKGAVAAWLPLGWFWIGRQHENVQVFDGAMEQVVGLVAALLGHSFSCFTKFRGGKGVATSVGGLVVLMPICVAIATVTWWIVFQLSRYVSLASIVASLALVAAAYAVGRPALLCGLAIIVAAFVILRHRTNIARLLNGTENKFTKKEAPAKS